MPRRGRAQRRQDRPLRVSREGVVVPAATPIDRSTPRRLAAGSSALTSSLPRTPAAHPALRELGIRAGERSSAITSTTSTPALRTSSPARRRGPGRARHRRGHAECLRPRIPAGPGRRRRRARRHRRPGPERRPHRARRVRAPGHRFCFEVPAPQGRRAAPAPPTSPTSAARWSRGAAPAGRLSPTLPTCSGRTGRRRCAAS